MAQNQSFEVIIGAKIKEFQKAMKTVTSSLKDASEKVKGLSDAVAPVSTAITGLGAAGVLASENISNAVSQFSTKLGYAGEELKLMENSMKQVAKTGVGSFDEVANAMTSMTQNMGKLSSKEMEVLTEQAMQLAKVMDADVSEITRSAGTLMKQFGIDGQKAMDLIAKGQQKGLNFSGEFLDSLNEYSVQFKSLGFSAEDMFNVMISGAESGAFNLDKVGDAIKEFNIRAKDGSDTTADAFKALGLNTKQLSTDFAAGGEKGKAAFMTVSAALSQVKNEQERNALGVALFGTQYEDLEKNVVASFGNIENKLGDYGGTSAKIAEQNKTFAQEMQGAWNEISIAIKPVGDILKKAVVDVMPIIIENVKKMSNWFSNLSGSNQKLVIGLGAFAAVLPVILTGIAGFLSFLGMMSSGFGVLASGAGKLNTGVFKLGKVFMKVGKAFLSLGRLFLTNPFFLIVTAIIVIAVLIYKNWDKIKKYLEIAWNAIKNTVMKVWNAISSFLKPYITGLVNFFMFIFNALKTYFMFVFNIYKTIFTTVWNVIKNVIIPIIVGIFNFIKFIFTAIWTFFVNIFTIWKALFTTAFYLLKAILTPPITAIWNFIVYIFTAIKNFFTKVFNIYMTIISTIWNAIKTVFTTVVNAIKTVIVTVFNKVKTTLSTIWNGIKTTVSTIWNGIKTTASTVFGKIKEAITGPIEKAKTKILEIIETIKNAFSKMKVKIPKPKLPKVNVTMKEKTIAGAKIPFPSFNIDWFKSGGIIKGTQGGSVVGVAEGGGDEAILPLSNKGRMKPFAHAVASMMPKGNNESGNITNNFNISSIVIREEADIEKVAKELAREQEKLRRAGGRLSYGN